MITRSGDRARGGGFPQNEFRFSPALRCRSGSRRILALYGYAWKTGTRKRTLTQHKLAGAVPYTELFPTWLGFAERTHHLPKTDTPQPVRHRLAPIGFQQVGVRAYALLRRRRRVRITVQTA
jgi:hypothetical protein